MMKQKINSKLICYYFINKKTKAIHSRSIGKVIKTIDIGKYSFLIFKDDVEWVMAESVSGLRFIKTAKLDKLLKFSGLIKKKKVAIDIEAFNSFKTECKRRVIESI